jgi:hypothetical protein
MDTSDDESTQEHERQDGDNRPRKRQRVEERDTNEPSSSITASNVNLQDEPVTLPEITEQVISTYSDRTHFAAATINYVTTRALYYKQEHKLCATVKIGERDTCNVEILFNENRVTNTKCSVALCQNGVLWCSHVCCALLCMIRTPDNVQEYGNLCRKIYRHSKEDLASTFIRLLTNNPHLIQKITTELTHYERNEIQHIVPPPPSSASAAPAEDLSELAELLPTASVNTQTHSINTREVEETVRAALEDYRLGIIVHQECTCDEDSDDSYDYYRRYDRECECDIGPVRHFSFTRVASIVNNHLDTVERLLAANDLYNGLDFLEKIGSVFVACDMDDLNDDDEDDEGEDIVDTITDYRAKTEHRKIIERMNDMLVGVMATADAERRSHWNQILETWCSIQDAFNVKPSFQEARECAMTSWDNERLTKILDRDKEAAKNFTESKRIASMRLNHLIHEKSYERARNYALVIKRKLLAAALLAVQGNCEQAIDYACRKLRCSGAAVVFYMVINHHAGHSNEALLLSLVEKFEFVEKSPYSYGSSAVDDSRLTPYALIEYLESNVQEITNRAQTTILDHNLVTFLFNSGVKIIKNKLNTETTRRRQAMNTSEVNVAALIKPIVFALLPTVLHTQGENPEVIEVVNKFASDPTISREQLFSFAKSVEVTNPKIAFKFGIGILKAERSERAIEWIVPFSIQHPETIPELCKALHEFPAWNEAPSLLMRASQKLIAAKQIEAGKDVLLLCLKYEILQALLGSEALSAVVLEYVFCTAIELDLVSSVIVMLAKSLHAEPTFLSKYNLPQSSSVRGVTLLDVDRSSMAVQQYNLMYRYYGRLYGNNMLVPAMILLEICLQIHALTAIPMPNTTLLENCHCRHCKQVLEFMTGNGRFLTFGSSTHQEQSHIRSQTRFIPQLRIQTYPTLSLVRDDVNLFTRQKEELVVYKQKATLLIKELIQVGQKIDIPDFMHELITDISTIENCVIGEQLFANLVSEDSMVPLAKQLGTQIIAKLQENPNNNKKQISMISKQLLALSLRTNDTETARRYMTSIMAAQPTLDHYKQMKSLYNAEQWNVVSSRFRELTTDKHLLLKCCFEDNAILDAHKSVMKEPFSFGAMGYLEFEMFKEYNISETFVDTLLHDYLSIVKKHCTTISRSKTELDDYLLHIAEQGYGQMAVKLSNAKTNFYIGTLTAKECNYYSLVLWLEIAVQIYQKADMVKNGKWNDVIAAVKQKHGNKPKLMGMINNNTKLILSFSQQANVSNTLQRLVNTQQLAQRPQARPNTQPQMPTYYEID